MSIEPDLPIWIRDRNGHVFDTALPAGRHRRIHIGLIHDRSPGFIEVTPGTRPPGGKLTVNRRTSATHYLLGGAAGEDGWLEDAAAHAEEIMRGKHQDPDLRFDPPREEVFLAPSTFSAQAGDKDAVIGANCLWVDVDGDVGSDEKYRAPFANLIATKPPHLIIESAGSGGRHAYWLLDEMILGQAEVNGLRDAPIERHNRKLVGLLGAHPDDPKQTIGDRACVNRTRVMRLAGTQNWKTSGWARIVAVDFALPRYTLEQLTGDLEDPTPPPARPRKPLPPGPRRDFDDWLRGLDPASYFWDLAGISVPDKGWVTCPFPDHEDRTPSCLVYGPGEGFYCFGCGRGGQSAIDLASAIEGGPTNRLLRGDAFLAAKQVVRERYGWVEQGETRAPLTGANHERT